MQLYIQIVDSKHNFFEIFLLTTFKTSFFFFKKSNKKTQKQTKKTKNPQQTTAPSGTSRLFTSNIQL